MSLDNIQSIDENDSGDSFAGKNDATESTAEAGEDLYPSSRPGLSELPSGDLYDDIFYPLYGLKCPCKSCKRNSK